MATKRPNTALLVIDVQNEVVANAHDRSTVLDNISTLVREARVDQMPVIWVQHADEDLLEGTEGWEIVSELDLRGDEPVVHNTFRDAFEATTLDDLLTQNDVGHLIVTGSQTDFGVRWTLHGAHSRGYDTTLVADAHTTDDPDSDELPSAAQTIALTNELWGSQTAPGRTARVLSTADVLFSLDGQESFAQTSG
jgi:nicotinamidase-related amidase